MPRSQHPEALNGELNVLHVTCDRDTTPERQRALESGLQLARNLGAQLITLHGKDTARTTASFLREHRITQAVAGRSATHALRSTLYYFALQKFMAEAPHVDLHIVTEESH